MHLSFMSIVKGTVTRVDVIGVTNINEGQRAVRGGNIASCCQVYKRT